MKRAVAARWVFAAIFVSVVPQLAVRMATASSSPLTVAGEGVHIPPAGDSVGWARSRAPFSLAEPNPLPPGTMLTRVMTSDSGNAAGIFSVDLFYTLPSGSAHMWQTNLDLRGSGKDPVADGEQTIVHGESWKLSRGNYQGEGASTFARRQSDGTTVSVDFSPEVEQASQARFLASLP